MRARGWMALAAGLGVAVLGWWLAGAASAPADAPASGAATAASAPASAAIPLREHPDQLRPFAPIEQSLPLRRPCQDPAFGVRIVTSQRV